MENWKNYENIDIPGEVWLPVINYVNYYECSNMGRVRSVNRIIQGRHHDKTFRKGRISHQRFTKCGYLMVILSFKGVKKHFTVHRLIARSFLNNTEDFPVVNHKNGIKSDNNLSNLEWATYKENSKHARNMGLFPKVQKLSGNKILEIFNSNKSNFYLASHYGVSLSYVNRIKSGRIWTEYTGATQKTYKFTRDDVRNIFLSSKTYDEISKDFNIGKTMIFLIKTKKRRAKDTIDL